MRDRQNRDRSHTPHWGQEYTRCIMCKCETCEVCKQTLDALKKAEAGVKDNTTTVNLCDEGFNLSKELLVNYTDLGRQIMILDIGAPVSLVGVAWMTQYLKEFDLTIEEMESVECKQVFRFGPSK